MNRIRRADLQQLLEPREGPCVSISLPMHLTGRDGMEDPVRLRNLADQAEDALVNRGLRSPSARNLLAPVRALPADNLAWQHRGEAVAIFVAPNFLRVLHASGRIEASVHVNDRFCVRPLLPLITEDDRFFLLAISQNRVRLFEGDAIKLSELEVTGIPRNMNDALKIENADRGEQVHSAMRGSLGKQAAVFHGQGGKPETAKEDLRQFLQQVASVVDRRLMGERVPLVVATVAATLPLWREISRYSYLADGFVAGNPDHLTPSELHAKSWLVAEPAVARRRDWLQQRLNKAEGTRVSAGLRQIVPAAIAGRIDALFLDCTSSRWGRYDAESHSAVIHAAREPGDQDLVELAAVETLRHRGEVIAVPHNNGKSGAEAEALLRF
jgi:hypothetical protein